MRTKLPCSNPDQAECPGRMRVVKTKALKTSVLRWRICTECGYKSKTRESKLLPATQKQTKKPKVVSFSELQKKAKLSHDATQRILKF